MQTLRAKRESVAQEESLRTLKTHNSLKSIKTVTFSKSAESHFHKQGRSGFQPYSVGEEVMVREVWAKQAQFLIEKVL